MNLSCVENSLSIIHTCGNIMRYSIRWEPEKQAKGALWVKPYERKRMLGAVEVNIKFVIVFLVFASRVCYVFILNGFQYL